ncbi:MAG TPA: S9 family peptidase [Gemmatimonadales bacterium]
MRTGLTSFLSVLVLLQAPLTAQQQTFDLDAIRQVVGVSDPAIAPDGKSIVIVVSRPNYEDNTFESELVLVDVASGTRRVLTYGRSGAAQPAWSPSGAHLAFLSPDEEKRPQIFLMPMAGGDARRITGASRGVQQFAWRPDGGALAFVTMDEVPTHEGAQRHLNAFEAGNNDVFLEAPIEPSHLWLVPVDGGDATRLTSGAWSVEFVLPPGSPPSPIRWSPDGASLAYIRLPNTYTGNGDSTTMQILDVASGESRGLTGAVAYESTPSFSPDGRTIAYWSPVADPANPAPYWSGNEVWLAPAGGGPGRTLTRPLDHNMFLSLWMPDGRSLIVAGNHETTVGLWQYPLDGNARQLNVGDLVVSGAFGYDVTVGPNGEIAFTATTAAHPAELYYMSTTRAEPKRLTDYNAWIDGYALGRMERVTWSSDEFMPDGVVIHPPDFSPDRSYPLVLLIHGGPMSASKTSFSTLGQVMAAQGWVVFQPNYRGSDNLGSAFQRAIVGDAGAGPGRDVMAGVAVLRSRSYVDGSRMAVTGWSYGGYMTSWLAGNYPDAWKAAMAGAAVTDLEDQYNMADFNVNMRYAMGGSPWTDDRQRAYREQSPISYATRITAPTLVMSATQDFRVPVTQSYKLFHALRDNGVETRFILYPGRTHFPGDPVRSLDVFRNWVEWVRTHLDPAAAPVP